ncbi:MAG TPA: 16S rRNA (cytosine(1402)-N(4))-methyltransferase RsmH [Clostridiales bacterium]|nr:16S rRNA (cytosine(1402)-N(4))-methyltransferase RsmH [Clostridiales bacterium]
MSQFLHQPVLLRETIGELVTKKDGIYVDCTMGGGGHSEAILLSGPETRVIGIDQDMEAIKASSKRLAPYGGRAIFVWDNFCNLEKILSKLNVPKVDGVLMDLGISSPQLDQAERGFSYQQDAALDMRMNRDGKTLTAEDLVNNLPEEELSQLIYRYGEERWAKRIAAFIKERREKQPIETTGELVEIIKAAIPKKVREEGHHPAKKTFQALRIAVNNELQIIAPTMEVAARHLNPGGILAVISFHSLEDRIVKETMKYLAADCICPPSQVICTCNKERLMKITVRKPITAGEAELAENPRARSAKLRVGMRI